VSHPTVDRWLDVLEPLYAIFRLPPLGEPRSPAVRKAQKHDHVDWTVVDEPAARFGNLVASHLLKWAQHHRGTQWRAVELRYFRDVDGLEVDFVLTDPGKGIAFVDCKRDDAEVPSPLRYVRRRCADVPAWQISAMGRRTSRRPTAFA